MVWQAFWNEGKIFGKVMAAFAISGTVIAICLFCLLKFAAVDIHGPLHYVIYDIEPDVLSRAPLDFGLRWSETNMAVLLWQGRRFGLDEWRYLRGGRIRSSSSAPNTTPALELMSRASV